MASGAQIGTPPSASTMSRKPRKSTTAKWSIRSPVLPSIVVMRHAGPPMLNIAFHCCTTHSSLGVEFLQFGGAGTIESRGTDTTVTCSRSAETCAMSVVSERAPELSEAPGTPSPSRLSEPMSRMLSGPAAAVGRVPRSLLTSIREMLPSSRHHATPRPSTTTSTKTPTPASTRRRRRVSACRAPRCRRARDGWRRTTRLLDGPMPASSRRGGDAAGPRAGEGARPFESRTAGWENAGSRVPVVDYPP